MPIFFFFSWENFWLKFVSLFTLWEIDSHWTEDLILTCDLFYLTKETGQTDSCLAPFIQDLLHQTFRAVFISAHLTVCEQMVFEHLLGPTKQFLHLTHSEVSSDFTTCATDRYWFVEMTLLVPWRTERLRVGTHVQDNWPEENLAADWLQRGSTQARWGNLSEVDRKWKWQENRNREQRAWSRKSQAGSGRDKKYALLDQSSRFGGFYRGA